MRGEGRSIFQQRRIFTRTVKPSRFSWRLCLVRNGLVEAYIVQRVPEEAIVQGGKEKGRSGWRTLGNSPRGIELVGEYEGCSSPGSTRGRQGPSGPRKGGGVVEPEGPP